MRLIWVILVVYFVYVTKYLRNKIMRLIWVILVVYFVYVTKYL